VTETWDPGDVGLLDNVRTVVGWSREAYARGPRWGRIVEVGRKLGPLTRIIVEIHYGHDEPFEHSTWTWVPRGVEPEVGQDVAISKSTGVEATIYEIVWDQPPHYGVPIDEAPSVIDQQLLDAWAEHRAGPPGP
jgi:hypothetical protein